MNHFARIVGGGLAALALLSACTKVGTGGGGGTEGRHAWTQAGVLRFAENADPKTLLVPLGTSAVTGDIASFIFSYAVRFDDKSQPVPDAVSEVPTVENGDVSKDGLTLKYKLRHNIKWHDGQPLTCDDMKFTWQLVMTSTATSIRPTATRISKTSTAAISTLRSCT